MVTPTYDERHNLPAFIQAVFGVLPAANILVVDDASPDGTGDVADEIAARDERVKVLHRPAKLGLGTAYLQAFELGLADPKYQRFFEMDADLSHDPSYLPYFLTALDQGADAVIGSRNIPGGGVQGWGVGRHVLSRGGSIYSRVILNAGIRDLTSGYKAFTRHALETIELSRVRSNGYSFQIEMTYRALQRGLRVVEVPIVFVDRRAGQSKMSRRIFAEAVGVVWRLRLQALRGKL